MPIDYKHIIHQLRKSKVLENYNYMTLLQVVSALIGFIIYPIVIRRVGVEEYGLYAFILSVVLYFQVVIEFGFDFPAIKAIALNRENKQEQSKIVSTIFYAKSALWIVMALLAIVIVWMIPMLRNQYMLFMVLFFQNAVNIFLPQWYFQGIKRMKVPTIINLICRLTQIPLVLWLVHDHGDIVVYASIATFTMLAGAVIVAVYMYRDGIRLQGVSRQQIASCFKAGWPFFLTDLAGNIKERVLTNMVGVFLGMREVAIYDLATKVVQIPRMLTHGINQALFPEVVTKASANLVKKILYYERRIGIVVIGGVIVLGYWVIWILGGKEMLSAYPVAVILSASIYTWLVVGAYLQFVFIPTNHYSLVTWNQVVALLTCLLIAGIGLWLCPSVLVVVSAIVLSGFAEIVFCRIMCKKKQLL